MNQTPPDSLPERIVTTGPSDSEKCQVLVDPVYAESFIKFLLERKIRLTPPEGGVVMPHKWQVEKSGKPVLHAFSAAVQPGEIHKLAAEWEKLGLNAPSNLSAT